MAEPQEIKLSDALTVTVKTLKTSERMRAEALAASMAGLFPKGHPQEGELNAEQYSIYSNYALVYGSVTAINGEEVKPLFNRATLERVMDRFEAPEAAILQKTVISQYALSPAEVKNESSAQP